jgi:hypothetical protein
MGWMQAFQREALLKMGWLWKFHMLERWRLMSNFLEEEEEPVAFRRGCVFQSGEEEGLP